MDVDDNGEMSWPNPVSPALFPQSPKLPEFQPPKNTSTTTPLSANFGSPNDMTPWTGKPQPRAAGNSSAVKESQTRRRRHKQRAKPSIYQKNDQQDGGLQQDQAPTAALEPSSPVKATHSSNAVPSKHRYKVPAFLRQHAAVEPAFQQPELDAFPSRREHITGTALGDDSDEPSERAGSSEAQHSDQPAQKMDDGLAMVDSLRKEGKLPTSSAAPSEDMSVDDHPPKKLSHAMRGLSALTADPPAQRKNTAARKPTNKSNTKVKMPALELEDANIVQDATSDPFDIGNIPSSQGAPRVVEKTIVKREAPAKASKAERKPTARQQKKAEETLSTSMSDDSEDDPGNVDSVKDNDEDYVERKPQPRATRSTGKTSKARPSAASKSQNGGRTEPKARRVTKDDKTSKTRSKTKLRAPMKKAPTAKPASGTSSAATSNDAAAKPQTTQMNLSATAASQRAEQPATALQTPIVRPNRSSNASECMSSSPKAPATRYSQADHAKKSGLINSAADRDKVEHDVTGAQEARKATIIPFGDNGPQTNGRRRKNQKVADEAAENEDSGVHLEPDVMVAIECKPEVASQRVDVHGRVEEESPRQDMAVGQPNMATKHTHPTLDTRTQSPEEESPYQERVGSAVDAQVSLKPSPTPNIGEAEKDAILHGHVGGQAEQRDGFVTNVDETPGGGKGLAQQKGPTLGDLDQDLASCAFSTSDESEKPPVIDKEKEKQGTEKRRRNEQACVEEEPQSGLSDDSDELSTGNSRTQARTHASRASPTDRSSIQPTQTNVRSGRASKTTAVHEPRGETHVRGHQNLKRPAPSDEYEQAAYPANQYLQLPESYQSLWGVGNRRVKDIHDVRSAPLVERVSERPILRAVANNADALGRFPSSGETFCMPANGHSSDDVFGPGKREEQMDIDPAVLERLRGRTSANRNVARHTVGTTSSVQRHEAASPGGHLKEGIGSDQAIEEDLLRTVGIRGLKRQRATINERSQRKGTMCGLERASEPVQVQERAADAMHQIVNSVLQNLESKEAAIHDAVADYVNGCTNIVRTVSGQHAKEREMLREENLQSGLRYIQVCEDVRGKVGSLSHELQDVDISKAASRKEGDETLHHLRRLQLALSAA